MNSFSNLFDLDFLKIQEFISKLNEEIVLLNLQSIETPEELIIQLIYQIKLYGTKIIDLYENLDHQYPTEKSVFESSDFQTNLSPIKDKDKEILTFQKKINEYENKIIQMENQIKLMQNNDTFNFNYNEINFELEYYNLDNVEEIIKYLKENFSKKEKYIEGCNLLQNIEYAIIENLDSNKLIQWLIISNKLKDQFLENLYENINIVNNQSQKILKRKNFFIIIKEIEKFMIKNQKNENSSNYVNHLEGKIEYLNEKIAQLTLNIEDKEENKNNLDYIETLNKLENEKMIREKCENDIAELLEEFALLKNKYEELLDEKQINSKENDPIMKNLIEENKKLKEEKEFAENLEDFEKLKENINEKDQKLEEMTLELKNLKNEIEISKTMLKDQEIQYLEKIHLIMGNVENLTENLQEIFEKIVNDQEITEPLVKQLQDLNSKFKQIIYIYPDYKTIFNIKKTKNKENSNNLTKFDHFLEDNKKKIFSQFEKKINFNNLQEISIIFRKEIENFISMIRNFEDFNMSEEKNLMEEFLKRSLNKLKQDHEKNEIKIQELEEKNNILQIKNKDLEKENENNSKYLKQFNELILHWQDRYKKIEDEIRNKEDFLQKTEENQCKISIYQDQLDRNEKTLLEKENIIQNYSKIINEKEKELISMNKEYNELCSKLNIIIKEQDELLFNLKFTTEENKTQSEEIDSLKSENKRNLQIISELKQNLDLSKDHAKSLNKSNEMKILEISEKFEEFKSTFMIKVNSLSKQNDELKNENLHMESLIKSQEKTISLKDEHLETSIKRIKYQEDEILLLETKIKEIKFIKEKNKKYYDSFTNSNVEINEIKKQNENLSHINNELERELFKKENIIIDLQHKISLISSQNEYFSSTQKYFEEDKKKNIKGENNFSIKNKNKEELNSSNNIELVEKLQKDLERITKERDNLKIEYQQIIESNEKLLLQSENLSIGMLKESNKFNNNSNPELSFYKNKVQEQQNLIEFYKKMNEKTNITENEIDKIMDSQKLENNFLQNLKRNEKSIDEKDKEIKRPSKIVKNLSAKCLKESNGYKKI